LTASFETDYGMTKIEKTIAKKGKNEDEVFDEQETKAVLRKYYGDMKQIFKNYAAGIGSGNEIFAMGKNAYYNLLETCFIMDEEGVKGGLGRAEAGLIFVVAQNVGPKGSFNKKNTLTRFQFMDAIVDMAIRKYRDTKVCSSTKEAVEKLLSVNILGKSDMKGLVEYKEGIMYTEEVDKVVKKNMPSLAAIFKVYSGKFNLPNEKDKTMSFVEWGELFFDCDLLADGFADRNMRIIFVRSQQTVVDEMKDKSSRSMNVVEFVHGVCWTAACEGGGETGLGKGLGVLVQKLVNRFNQHLKLANRKKKG